jgi:hypothetical protein
MLQIRGAKGEAVLVYRESLATKEMRYPRLSGEVNKMTNFYIFLECAFNEFHDSRHFLPKLLVLLICRTPRHLIYATIGFIFEKPLSGRAACGKTPQRNGG